MDVSNINKQYNIDSLKLKLAAGTTIYGKIISTKNNLNIIKLIDGTILPAVFISENTFEIQRNKYMKFYINKISNNIFELKLELQNTSAKDNTPELISQNLNIPDEDALSIINSLMKFNLPINNENILGIYKNLAYIKKIKNYSDDDILSFIRENINENISPDDELFNLAKHIFSDLKDVDIDFLSFLIENNISMDAAGSLKVKSFIRSNFLINMIIDKFAGSKTSNSENMIFHELRNIEDNIQNNNSAQLPPDLLNKFLDQAELLKLLSSNYNYYFFNTYFQGQAFKNNLIFKKNYKDCGYMDLNNIKLFLLVETPKLGNIEGFIHKFSNNISVILKVEKAYLPVFKSELKLLQNTLKKKGYNAVNLSVEKKEQPTDIISASSFFNTVIFKKLDVKI